MNSLVHSPSAHTHRAAETAVLGWQPIGTAPRDGTRIIARIGTWAPFECAWDGERFVHDDPDDGLIAYVPDQWWGPPAPLAANTGRAPEKAALDPSPPWPMGGAENNSRRAGWLAFYEGKPRSVVPFPASRNDLRKGYEIGWDAAQKAAQPDASQPGMSEANAPNQPGETSRG